MNSESKGLNWLDNKIVIETWSKVWWCSGSCIWLSYIHRHLLITSGVYLKATQRPAPSWLVCWQLIEHCTSIAEVMGSNPVQAWILFRPYFNYCSGNVHYCKDRFHIQAVVSFRAGHYVNKFSVYLTEPSCSRNLNNNIKCK